MLSTRFRNIGIIAHVDAGKTTLSERILYFAGRIRKPGEVHNGNTQLDWTPQEKRHGITITAAATTVQWRSHAINLVDTPGHIDFSVEVSRSLRVLDGAVVVLDAGNGVEPQTEAVWRRADELAIPRLVFINKMDRVGASFANCLRSLKERLGAKLLPVQLPLGEEAEHRGFIDLLRGVEVTFDAEGNPTERPCEGFEQLPERQELVEYGALAGEELSRALRLLTLEEGFVPVLCGSAYKNRGVQALLDAVVAYLPSPVDRMVGHPAVHPERAERVERVPQLDTLAAFVFKLEVHPHLGRLAFVRVFSGALEAGSEVWVPRLGRSVRVGRVLRVHAHAFSDEEKVEAGDLCVVAGMGELKTGDTLCDERAKVVLEPMHFPEPLVELALEPRSRAELPRLTDAVRRMAEEDPTLQVSTEAETGRVVLRGMGELHLQICLEKLEDANIACKASAPKVAYRETVRRSATATFRLKKQGGGPGQFAQVTLEVAVHPERAKRVEGVGNSSVHPERSAQRGVERVPDSNPFKNLCKGGSVPSEYVAGVEKGVRGALSRGVLEAGPMVDVEVRLLDGQAHSNDSSARAFEIAGSMACQEALKAADPVRLEPVMAVEVVVPEARVGAVLGDLSSRRGRVLSMSQRSGAMVVEALVPLAELFGYVDALRSKTEGRGTCSMRPHGYAEG
jgi:elongation factor G